MACKNRVVALDAGSQYRTLRRGRPPFSATVAALTRAAARPSVADLALFAGAACPAVGLAAGPAVVKTGGFARTSGLECPQARRRRPTVPAA